MEHLHITMFGPISLQTQTSQISENDNRTKKIWLLLSYLICQKGRVVSQQKLVELLWGEEPASSNPENALRITFHRLRSLLNQLWPTAGRDLILHKDNGYTWNEAYPLTLDYERFESLLAQHFEDADRRLSALEEALALYQGDFLEKQSSETWVIPITTHFHNLYIQAAMEAVQLLSQQKRHQDAVAVCQKAILTEPYHEPLHQLLIREFAALEDSERASEVYHGLCKRLFDDFGIRPSEETRQVYRSVAHSLSEKSLAMDEVLEHLQEPASESGAMRCDYDYFKVLCFAQSRSLARSGQIAHILLLSVSSGNDVPLAKATQSRIMHQLGEQIRTNLRRGDIFSQCSISQYIVLLPQANYENSCMVCRRIIGAFNRRHPHVTAKLHYMVQPLSPEVNVP